MNKKIGVAAVGIAAAVVLLGLASSSFYKVSEQEQAIVTQFGKVRDVKTAGLYFKIPVVQQVHMVDTTTHGMKIGYSSDGYDGEDYEDYEYTGYSTVEHEAVMITSDFNFVDIDFYLEYRVSDPQKYLYTSKKPDEILRNLAQSAIRTTVSDYTVDDVITTGKSQIQAQVRERLSTALSDADIGLEVVNLSVQDAEPPTADVMKAFKAVETAKQGADTAVNNANQYQNEQLPAAEAEADQIVQEAEATKEARIAEAEGQVARYTEMYEQYKLNPEVTKKRLFYETMEDVLPSMKIIIDSGDTQKVLPLDTFFNEETEETSHE